MSDELITIKIKDGGEHIGADGYIYLEGWYEAAPTKPTGRPSDFKWDVDKEFPKEPTVDETGVSIGGPEDWWLHRCGRYGWRAIDNKFTLCAYCSAKRDDYLPRKK